ncbi:hypothetical protein C8Q75DRAFT_730129 [Abortiporus biennis]|nr:hypothetical protein C8Q75DRAFT_730129 [Abortiporus biennis]
MRVSFTGLIFIAAAISAVSAYPINEARGYSYDELVARDYFSPQLEVRGYGYDDIEDLDRRILRVEFSNSSKKDIKRMGSNHMGHTVADRYASHEAMVRDYHGKHVPHADHAIVLHGAHRGGSGEHEPDHFGVLFKQGEHVIHKNAEHRAHHIYTGHK